MLEKGSTRLAIYGMGYIPDERLSRMFEQHNVTFFEPPQSADWFHLFIIHQNCEGGRNRRTMRLDLLPPFLQLVIWGHEHECKIDPVWNDEGVATLRLSDVEIPHDATGILVHYLAHRG